MKIRLHGTEDECRELAGRLPAITDVLSVSEPYPDRGASRLVRMYVECRPYPAKPGWLYGQGCCEHWTPGDGCPQHTGRLAMSLKARELDRPALPPGGDQ